METSPNSITVASDPRDNQAEERTQKMISRASKGQDMSTVKTLRFKCHWQRSGIIFSYQAATISFVFVTPLSCARRGWPLFCENQLPGFTDFPMWPLAEGVQSQSCRKLDNIKIHKTVLLRDFGYILYECGTLWLFVVCSLPSNDSLAKFDSWELSDAKGLGSMPSIIDALSNA